MRFNLAVVAGARFQSKASSSSASALSTLGKVGDVASRAIHSADAMRVVAMTASGLSRDIDMTQAQVVSAADVAARRAAQADTALGVADRLKHHADPSEPSRT